MTTKITSLLSVGLALTGVFYGTTASAQQDIWFNTPTAVRPLPAWGQARTSQEMGSGSNTDKDWENRSLPLGNGSIGANILGTISEERITLNEKTLWLGGPNTSKGAAAYWDVNKQSGKYVPIIRQLLSDGKVDEATALLRQHFTSNVPYDEGAREHSLFGGYTTLGELRIKTPLKDDGYSQYRRSLSLDSAVATVAFTQDGVRYRRRSFISYPDNVMVLELSADRPAQQSFVLTYLPNILGKGVFTPDGENGFLYSGRLNNNNMEFAVRLKAVNKGGTVRYDNGQLIVERADRVIIYLTADTDYWQNTSPDMTNPTTYVGVVPQETTKAWMRKAVKRQEKKLLKRHLADYQHLFHRVQLHINSDRLPDIPTDELLRQYRKGNVNHALESLYFQFGRYLLIASSRDGNLPANLQGIWANNVDAPWRADYHLNINLQMNYWMALTTNLAECQKPLNDYIKSLVVPGRQTASQYFGARGWTASISGNIFGFTAPLDSHDLSWNYNPMAGPWLATHLWDYYAYTQDKTYLTQVYDIIAESADFTVDYLHRLPDGTYTASPSTSPEHGPVDEGATFAHGVAREILADAVSMAEVLGRKDQRSEQWQKVLRHIAPYKIGRYGQLMEWSVDIDDPKDQHRHVNHLYGLHPGRSITPTLTPHLAQAARVVLEHRGDGATGWSMGWKLNQWARLHDGNHAYMLFGNLLKNGTLDNLWDTHPPFQIDGNFGGTAGVAEMLMQSHTGTIHLLPALPDAWHSGSVSGLVAQRNVTVDMTWAGGKLLSATFRPHHTQEVVFRYGQKTHRLLMKGGKKQTIFFEHSDIKSLK